MEAKELRIGNLVSWKDSGKEFKITLQSLYEGANLDWKPIPLTEEWLLNFGYFKLDHNGSVHFVVKGHIIWLCNNLIVCEKNGVILKYVHQLQNLYFALTNEELIIKTK